MKKMERPLFTGNAFKFDIAMLNVHGDERNSKYRCLCFLF